MSIWRNFNNFLIKLEQKPKLWEEHVAWFAAYLVNDGIQSSTLKSYISAIKAILKCDKYKWNDNYLELSSITRACKIENDEVKTRLPISKGLLELILFELQRYFNSQPYLETLYQAMILIAYYRLMRVGEITQSTHNLLAKNIHIGSNKDKILLVLYSSKTHNKNSAPQEIKISVAPSSKCHTTGNRFFCPFKIIRRYLGIWGNYMADTEPFFIFQDRSPVQANHLRQILRLMISHLNLNPTLYDMHSLRIGRTCQLFRMGVSISRIKKIGRWKSNAVYHYLKNL